MEQTREQIHAWLGRCIVEGIQLLSASARRQVGHYPSFVNVGNELVRDLGDPVGLLIAADGQGCYTARQWQDIEALVDAANHAACQDYSSATEEAWLSVDAEWARVRIMAAELLDWYDWGVEAPGDAR